MRLGLFGGTFDPVHYGHLIMAECCREQCELDEVWFLPAGHPPHKGKQGISSGTARAEMLELAVAGCPKFQVSRIELGREGRSYTVDTLQQLFDEDASRELFFLMGTDSLRDLPSWHEPERITQLATVVVANRGGDRRTTRDELVDLPGAAHVERIRFVRMPAIALSATEIRRHVGNGASIRFQTPRAVQVYVQEHGLYLD